ncbi:unnamed protein product [Adineta steineri]|uniref:Uncharacterized protein n=1 Tax=Adineta steineri TaxID=433720 RepID=A0A820D5M6_9BILA|nr:unnamed protein product [Adineta steineri]
MIVLIAIVAKHSSVATHDSDNQALRRRGYAYNYNKNQQRNMFLRRLAQELVEDEDSDENLRSAAWKRDSTIAATYSGTSSASAAASATLPPCNTANCCGVANCTLCNDNGIRRYCRNIGQRITYIIPTDDHLTLEFCCASVSALITIDGNGGTALNAYGSRFGGSNGGYAGSTSTSYLLNRPLYC